MKRARFALLFALSTAPLAAESGEPAQAARPCDLLAFDLEKFEPSPKGLVFDAGRGRKQDLPFRRPVPLAHRTLISLVTASGSTLVYPTAWNSKQVFAASAALIPAGKPEEIRAGRVRFSAEFRAPDGALLGQWKAEIATSTGRIEGDGWSEARASPTHAAQPDLSNARLELKTQAFGEDGKERASTPEVPAPLGVWACWGDARIVRPGPEDATPAVFLITFDTLRADRLGCYGNRKRATPAFDALAARGFLFERCYSPSCWTLPAYQAMLSGLHPAHLGYGVAAAHDPTEDNFAKLRYGRSANLPDTLRAARGFYSFASTGGGMLEPWQNNFLKGFSSYWANPKHERQQERTEAGSNADDFANRLSAPRAGPLFGFYHTYEPHTPYADARYVADLKPGRVKAPFGEGDYLAGGLKALHAEYSQEEKACIEALHDGDVAASDEALARLAAEIEKSGLSARAWIVVTADHGEEFWEHGGMSHGHSLYDELLRVPLIVVPPGGLKEGARIAAPASLLDLFPTFCDLLGVKGPPNLLGRSLKPLLDSDPARRAAVKLEEPPGLFVACGTFHGPTRWAIRHGGWKYIQTVEPESWAKDPANRQMMRLEPEELYDLEKDPGEKSNLAGAKDHEARRKALAERLRLIREGVLKPFELAGGARSIEAPPLDPDLLEKLKKLGY